MRPQEKKLRAPGKKLNRRPLGDAECQGVFLVSAPHVSADEKAFEGFYFCVFLENFP
jgi:hypothetical protein